MFIVHCEIKVQMQILIFIGFPQVGYLITQLLSCDQRVPFFSDRVVEFSSESDMQRAIDKLDGSDLNGKKIKLVEERRGGGGGRRR